MYFGICRAHYHHKFPCKVDDFQGNSKNLNTPVVLNITYDCRNVRDNKMIHLLIFIFVLRLPLGDLWIEDQFLDVGHFISVTVITFLLLLARRKSNIVKEMDKMKNKREEKRAQFSEIRNKRAQVRM